MGIRGLKSYVNSLPSGDGQVWKSFDLHNTNLVIDGNGLYFYIYKHNKLNCKFGGQYDEFQNKVKEFISKLLQNNVEPYVVFDGIGDKDEKKSATYTKRNKDKIEKIKNLWTPTAAPTTNPGSLPTENHNYIMVLPRLAKLAVMQVLKEMEVKYAVADFEADCEIASLANKLNAPVLGYDSDFCIFNISRGYIPFKHLKFSDSKITATKFSSDAFARHLGLDPSMLPLYASLAGNDYISDEMLKPFHDHFVNSDKFQNIAQFLSSHNSDSEAAIDAVINLFPNDDEKAAFKNALDRSIKAYQMKQSNLIDFFDPAFSGDLSHNMLTYNGDRLPQCVVKRYRQGLISSEGLNCLCNREIFLRIQSEDIKSPSAHICAEGLRRHYYKLILNCEDTTNTASTSQATTEDIVVTECGREKSELVEKKVNLTLEVPEMNVQIHDRPRMSNEDRKSHILGLLDPDRSSSIHDHSSLKHHQLVAAAMKYWVIHTEIKPAHLAALLVHYVDKNESLTTEESFEEDSLEEFGSSSQWQTVKKKRSSRLSKSPKISSKEFHGFAQWQNVLHWAEWLNRLFPSTLPPLQVAKLYDGLRVCEVYEKLKVSGVTSAESMVTNKDDYNRLYNAITPSRKRQHNEEDMTLGQKKKKTKSKSSEILEGNPFASLRPSDLESD